MTSPEVFNENYFERGPQLGLSLYENFRWLPEVSIPMARQLKIMYPGKSILDFGCAKGYLVKALVSIGVVAYGMDISTYAISRCDENIRHLLFEKIEPIPSVDLVFCKDTLEHIPEEKIVPTLIALKKKSKNAFMIVPLGENGKYRIQDYDKDLTHIIKKPEAWWTLQFKYAGFKIETMTYFIKGFKEKWVRIHKTGNAFYLLKS